MISGTEKGGDGRGENGMEIIGTEERGREMTKVER